MKMTPQDFERLKACVQPFDTPQRRAAYLAGDFSNASRCKDLAKRYRWDCLWASGVKIGDGVGIKGDIDLYSYLNDEHIDTALLRIVQPGLLDPH